MLSGETAVGAYPVEAVACMHRIAVETEVYLRRQRIQSAVSDSCADIDDPITLAACSLAGEVGATAIVTPTLSGRTAKLVARHRPWARVVAVAPTDAVLQRLALVWGITPVRMTPVPAGGDRMAVAVQDAFAAGTVTPGERVVVLAGHPVAGGPRFPTLRVVGVGDGGTSTEP
jgi:pyruvate kinase